MSAKIISLDRNTRDLQTILGNAIDHANRGEVATAVVVIVTINPDTGEKEAQLYTAGIIRSVETIGWLSIIQHQLLMSPT